jgi:aldehyde dehydrogenase (NAD+)
MKISNIIENQRAFYYQGNTLTYKARLEKLKALKQEIEKQEQNILEALNQDFKKSYYEGYMTEIAMVYLDLKAHIKNLKKWMKPQTVWPSLLNFPSTEAIQKQPYGSTLIISPWNYPFLLCIQPLVSAIAAGNVVVLKPSELTPATSQIIENILKNVFPENWVKVIQGGVETTTEILACRFDFIFFTGSPTVGKIIHQAASQYLTPTVLELGGKSPCIITPSANLELAANRIVFGKFVNAGQTCVAPDFIWIHESVKDKFLKILAARIVFCYGTDIEKSDDFPRIINLKNFNRLKALLGSGKIYFGGKTNENSLYIEPTILNDVSFNDAVMQEEIFGPILPVLTYTSLDEVVEHNHANEKPLAFYIFSSNKTEINSVLSQVQFGGGCANDVLTHLVNKNLPLGGFGNSGMGNYHGKHGFDTFTHMRGFVNRGTWLDIPVKYAPYQGKISILKRLINVLKN